jgi:hypothetical protein
MAKILFGNIVADTRGSIGGVTYARNSSGAYARQKVSPVQPETPIQVATRAQFEDLSKQWPQLTNAQREAWRDFAAHNPVIDRFGLPVTLNGNAMFVRLNRELRAVDPVVPFILTPPSTLIVGELLLTSLTLTAGGPFTYTFTATRADAFVLSATAPLSPGQHFAGNRFRQIFASDPHPASPFDFTAAYEASYFPAPVGSRIFVRAKMVNFESGAASRWDEENAIVS